jgi:hypothetical protein
MRQLQACCTGTQPHPGALSHGNDSLEQWLDVELFERKARGVILTAAGRQYLPYISEALSMIATGTLRLPSRRFEDRLSISTTALFAFKLLLPACRDSAKPTRIWWCRWMPVSRSAAAVRSIRCRDPQRTGQPRP